MSSSIIYLSLLLNKLAWSEICEDAYSCVGCEHDYFKNQECVPKDQYLYGEAYCYGFQSCMDNKFVNMNKVECLGGDSCKEAKPIIANESVTCSGYESCFKIRDITSLDSSIKCIGHLACKNGDLTAVNGDIICSSFGSCLKSKAETSSLSCLGFKSCQQMSHAGVLSNAHCDGGKSCAQSTFVAENIYCRGKQSCEKMKSLEISGTANGYGYKSLYGANMYAKIINAYGYRSIEQANIDTGNLQNTDIIINAFGFDAAIPGRTRSATTTILCRDTTNCTLNCRGNGCNGIEISCLLGSNCNIQPYDCQINHNDGSYSKQEWVSCPVYISSQSEEQDQLLLNRFLSNTMSSNEVDDEKHQITEMINKIESQYNQLLAQVKDDQDQKAKLTEYKEMELEIELNSWKEEVIEEDDSVSTEVYAWNECDDALECEGRVFNTSSPEALCIGYMSCLESEFDYDGDILCYGYKSCMNASQIYTSGDRTTPSRDTGTPKGIIKCQSTKSCYSAESISAKETVSCLGKLSCSKVGLIESRSFTVKCHGSMSCMNVGLISSPQKIECYSLLSCANSNISTQTISCNGPESCKATILSGNSIKCEGMRSCSDSIITTSMYKAYGWFDSMDSIIYANFVYGYGHGSLAFAHIRSKPDSMVKVFSYGYNSGFGVDYDCVSGSICRLFCLYNGCENLHFNCFLGSKCFVYLNGTMFKDPSGFDQYDYDNDTDIININGTIAPKWNYAKEVGDYDQELTKLIKERRLNNKYDTLYQQVMNERLSGNIFADQDEEDEQDEMEEMMYDLEVIESVRIDTKEMLNGQQNIKQWIHAIILTILGIMFIGIIIVTYYKCLKIKPQNLKPEYQPLLI